jgi:hypothetical protein
MSEADPRYQKAAKSDSRFGKREKSTTSSRIINLLPDSASQFRAARTQKSAAKSPTPRYVVDFSLFANSVWPVTNCFMDRKYPECGVRSNTKQQLCDSSTSANVMKSLTAVAK